MMHRRRGRRRLVDVVISLHKQPSYMASDPNGRNQVFVWQKPVAMSS